MTERAHQGSLGRGAAILAVCLLTAVSVAGAQSMCVACHSNPEFLRRIAGDSVKAQRLFVQPARYQESVHGKLGFDCTLCHRDLGDFPHGAAAPVGCGGCHPQASAQLAVSVHGQTHPETGDAAATCGDCHTHHHILGPSDPSSSVYRLTQFEICATCHEDRDKMGRFGQENISTVASYRHSVHGRGLLEKGLSVAPVCTDCHGVAGTGAHSIKTVSDSTGT
ncbi:MAG: cytochrome c3 family protein, partial [Gemmatimonadota bacterium]|nr:cytochrome c3 family protein [Gemmatimonadota bacterium]